MTLPKLAALVALLLAGTAFSVRSFVNGRRTLTTEPPLLVRELPARAGPEPAATPAQEPAAPAMEPEAPATETVRQADALRLTPLPADARPSQPDAGAPRAVRRETSSRWIRVTQDGMGRWRGGRGSGRPAGFGSPGLAGPPAPSGPAGAATAPEPPPEGRPTLADPRW